MPANLPLREPSGRQRKRNRRYDSEASDEATSTTKKTKAAPTQHTEHDERNATADPSDNEGIGEQPDIINIEDDEGRNKEHEEILDDMQRTWTSPLYGFFDPVEAITYINGRPCVEFTCSARTCERKVRRFLDTKDRGSTSNLKRHASQCWGDETVNNSLSSNAEGVRKGLARQKYGM